MLIPSVKSQTFDHVWRALCKIWRSQPHCLERGCGRETLAQWVNYTCRTRYPAWLLRAVLDEACSRGLVEKTRALGGYSCYWKL